jgi:hypothetical protein
VQGEFGGRIRLIGYDVNPPLAEWRSAENDALEDALAIHWQALAPMDTQYKVFIHIVGEAGPADIRAQADFYPHLPTSGWIAGEYLSDVVSIELPSSLESGSYALVLGLYEESTGIRLAASSQSGAPAGDSLVLAEFELGE